MWEEAWSSSERVFLCLIPPAQFAQQEALAHQLPGVTVLDWRTEFLRAICPEKKFLSLDAQTELERIKSVSEAQETIVCWINTEYLLSRLNQTARAVFWHSLARSLRYTRSSIVFCALDSPELRPDAFELEFWRTRRRFLTNLLDFSEGEQ